MSLSKMGAAWFCTFIDKSHASLKAKLYLTVDPRADVKDEDTRNFLIVLSVRGGQGE